MRQCGYCGAPPGPGTRAVAAIDLGSGPGATVHACGECLEAMELVPMADWPPEWPGGILHREELPLLAAARTRAAAAGSPRGRRWRPPLRLVRGTGPGRGSPGGDAA